MIRTSFSMITNTSPFGIESGNRLVRPAGSRKNRPTANSQREHDRARPGAAADLLLLALLVGRAPARWRRCRAPEADLERLGQRDHAAHDRQAQQPVALGPRDERLGDHLDLAVRALLGVGLAGRELLRRGLAHRHRPGGDAAHHHALEHGLAADRGVLGRLPRCSGAVDRWSTGTALTAPMVSARRSPALSSRQIGAGDLVRVVGLVDSTITPSGSAAASTERCRPGPGSRSRALAGRQRGHRRRVSTTSPSTESARARRSPAALPSLRHAGRGSGPRPLGAGWRATGVAAQVGQHVELAAGARAALRASGARCRRASYQR